MTLPLSRLNKKLPPLLHRQKYITARGLPDVPDGTLIDVTPAPGRSYTRATWPPRGRGRSESLASPRRVAAKFRALEALRLRGQGYTWRAIALLLGYADGSGPFRAVQCLLSFHAPPGTERRSRRRKKTD